MNTLFTGGTQQICAKLVEKIGQDKVLLNSKAVKIIQNENCDVQVLLGKETIRAKKVLITVPPNIISKNISFQPGS